MRLADHRLEISGPQGRQANECQRTIAERLHGGVLKKQERKRKDLTIRFIGVTSTTGRIPNPGNYLVKRRIISAAFADGR
jgi:hypothetical protein